jgi:hypothetical protein
VTIAEFSFSWNPLMRVLMTLLLAGPRHSSIRVDHDTVRVRMGVGGWAFTADVPLSSVVDAAEVKGPVWAWGAHGWRARWLVNGSSRGLVQLTIMPKARGRCMVFPLHVGELTLSLAEPAEFVRAVTPAGAAR